MSWCPTINFQLSIMSKWLAKHISTKVSFKITVRKIHVYIDIRWPWIWNQYFYLGIWNDDRRFVFISSPYTIKIRTHRKMILLINTDTLNCIWILVFPFRIIEVSTTRIWSLSLYFSFLNDYWPPTTRNSLVPTSLCEMEWCEKQAFQHLKIRKKKISWNIKTKCVTDNILRVWSTIMKNYTCHYGVST